MRGLVVGAFQEGHRRAEVVIARPFSQAGRQRAPARSGKGVPDGPGDDDQERGQHGRCDLRPPALAQWLALPAALPRATPVPAARPVVATLLRFAPPRVARLRVAPPRLAPLRVAPPRLPRLPAPPSLAAPLRV